MTSMRALATLLLAAFLAPSAPAQDAPSLVLKGARVVTGTGATLEGAAVLIRHGRIEAVGKEIDIPWGAEEIDCRGLWVYPGFLHIASRQGLPAGAPELKAAAAIKPGGPEWKRYLEAGFTTVGLVPRGRGVAGQVAVLKPRGATREEMLVIESAALALGAGGDGTTAKAVGEALAAARAEVEARKKEREEAEKRKKEEEAKKAEEARKAAEAKAGGQPAAGAPTAQPGSPATQPATRPAASQPASQPAGPRKVPTAVALLADVLEGQIPAFLEVAGPTGLLYLERALGKERFPLLLLADGSMPSQPPISILAGKVKGLDAAIVLPVGLASPPFRETLINQAAAFRAAGVDVLLQPGLDQELDSFRLRLAQLVRHGWDAAEALAALTTRPARWLGVSERVGTIEKGKDADLLLFSGDFLDVQSRLVRVILEGETVYEHGKD